MRTFAYQSLCLCVCTRFESASFESVPHKNTYTHTPRTRRARMQNMAAALFIIPPRNRALIVRTSCRSRKRRVSDVSASASVRRRPQGDDDEDDSPATAGRQCRIGSGTDAGRVGMTERARERVNACANVRSCVPCSGFALMRIRCEQELLVDKRQASQCLCLLSDDGRAATCAQCVRVNAPRPGIRGGGGLSAVAAVAAASAP